MTSPRPLRRIFVRLFLAGLLPGLIAGIACAPSVARADKTEKGAPDPCATIPTDTQAEMDASSACEYAQADARLNAVYQKIVAAIHKMDDDAKSYEGKLKRAEEAWIHFRDAECDLESFPNRGGTIYPVIYTGCATELTNVRATQLQAILNQP